MGKRLGQVFAAVSWDSVRMMTLLMVVREREGEEAWVRNYTIDHCPASSVMCRS